MEPVHCVAQVFSPLDEELELLPGSLTPKQQENLSHLASWMPFEKAGEMLTHLVGVQVSEATVRRTTERHGARVEAAHLANQEEAQDQTRGGKWPEKVVLSADGAFVPLVKGEWAEVRTLAIGEVNQRGRRNPADDGKVTALSYFSRMAPASAFVEQVHGEMQRRAVGEATAVCAVTDGAEWLQGLIDLHRPDAVRVLDFPHAAGHLNALLEALQPTGIALPEKALDRCLHVLKHRGPAWLLRSLARLPASIRELETVREHLSYLSKREAFMQYPLYRQQGWPIGSGMVESANKVVVQARLKGAGMHWAAHHVNPMLALRTSVCNDRWEEAWHQGELVFFSQRTHRVKQRSFSHLWSLAAALAWVTRRLQPAPVLPPSPPPIPRLPPAPPGRVAGRPTTHHPWKRAIAVRLPLSAKK